MADFGRYTDLKRERDKLYSQPYSKELMDEIDELTREINSITVDAINEGYKVILK